MKTIYLAGGCFWGTQHFMRQIRGVTETRVGYANGHTDHPTYDEVKHNHTGHAETVEVVYDETILPTRKLLKCYFLSVDPTSLNRQGMDFGTQYRTGIWYTDESLAPDVEAALQELAAEIGCEPVIEHGPLQQFFDAETYHQDYLVKNPAGYCHISRELLEKAKSL